MLKQHAVWGLPQQSFQSAQSACSPVYLLSTSAFSPLGSTHSHSAERYVWFYLKCFSMCVRLRYAICAEMRARCAHLSQQTKKPNNTSFGGTQQVGDRERDATVSDGYLPFTVAVEWCQPTTHPKRICNANESARVLSGWSNLCSTHKVHLLLPYDWRSHCWTGSMGMSVLHVCVFRSLSTKSHDRIVTNVVRPLKGGWQLKQDSHRRATALLHLLLV